MKYAPEGLIFETRENKRTLAEPRLLSRCRADGTIVEAKAVRCDTDCALYVELGESTVRIPREEAIILPETQKDIAILSKVGRPVCFKVLSVDFSVSPPELVLSRRAAQEEAMNYFMTSLVKGDVIWVRPTRLESFGVFVDMGCGIPSFIGIENISVSRISHPSERLETGRLIPAVVTDIDRIKKRITLSHRELLGTWAENAQFFNEGETVEGIVRGVESYGVFIELTPNLTGLAEPMEGLRPGNRVCVYIKSIIPDRMKLKLAVIDVLPGSAPRRPLRYFITCGHIDNWRYDAPASNEYYK